MQRTHRSNDGYDHVNSDSDDDDRMDDDDEDT